ncbi:hypothetical protein [Methanosphaerula palustris]|nr:hypothetical protein [Methanosphaerula palustris]
MGKDLSDEMKISLSHGWGKPETILIVMLLMNNILAGNVWRYHVRY